MVSKWFCLACLIPLYDWISVFTVLPLCSYHNFCFIGQTIFCGNATSSTNRTYLHWTQNIPSRAGLNLFTQEGFSSPLQQEKLLSVECEHFSQLNNSFLCLDLFPLSIALFAARVLSFTWPQKQIGPNNSSVYSLRSPVLWLLCLPGQSKFKDLNRQI